ncbi:MAG: hypothetical protein QXO53_05600, partial [Fervidicoccaceae archaeon]
LAFTSLVRSMIPESPAEGEAALIIFPNGEERVIILERNKVVQTKYGILRHNDILNRNWGESIETSTGFKVMFQKPSYLEVVYNLFRRKSQVIYEKDAAIMISLSGIGPGSMVGESGVGSGFLTAHILKAIRNKEEYYGYEIRDDMATTAIENLKLLGYDVRDRIFVKDIRKGIDEKGFDAFFLDIPDPWEAMTSIYSSLSSSARVIVFVPSVNQILKTLNDPRVIERYYPYKVLEIMSREYEREGGAIRPAFFQKVFSGYIMVFLRKTSGEKT